MLDSRIDKGLGLVFFHARLKNSVSSLRVGGAGTFRGETEFFPCHARKP
jgi:hypothetical protein